MKKLIPLFTLLATVLLPQTASAYDFMVNGLCYNITSEGEVEVTYEQEEPPRYSSLNGAIVIPSSVTYNGTTYSVTSIGNETFYNCNDLTSVIIGNSVTSIGEGAFSYCASMTSVTIPNSVISIGNNAFNRCSGLTSVAIPNSVTSIGSSAFYSCSGLTSITIGNSVTSIGSSAFRYCRGLTSVTIPKSITSMGHNAFQDCSGLANVVWYAKKCDDLSSDYPPFKDLSNIKTFTFGDDIEKIPANLCRGLSGLTSVTIPKSVTSIGNSAFYGCSALTSVQWNVKAFAKDLSSSNDSPFSNNSNIKTFTFGDEVEMIPSSLCFGLRGLTSVTIPNSVLSIGGWAFYGCSSLKNITIGNSVTSIGGAAFRDCRGLTSVTIPNSVTSIGNEAFNGCSALTSITIPSSVTSIGSSAFTGTPWFDYQPEGLVYIGSVAYKYKGTMPSGTSIHIKEGIVTISDYVFYNFSNLRSVTIPNSVTNIGNSAFQGCTGLTSVTIPNSVISIGSSAFNGCSGLTSVTLSNSLSIIRYQTFYGCSGLTSITIPNSVNSIESYAFEGCSGLTSVTIPNSVTTIESYAFEGCSGLTNVTIPNSVSSIGSSTFEGCSGLTSVTIPNSVTSIGDRAFCNCTSLTSVTISNSFTRIGSEAFSGTPWFDNQPDGLVYVGFMAYAYKGSMPSGTSISIKEGTVSLSSRVFYNCRGLASITIPNSVTSIGNSAFEGCTGLTSVTIPNSVTSIGYNVFYNCSGLTSVTIPNSVTVISSRAFWGCTGLTSVTIPNTVTRIESNAFYGCTGLTNITIPNSVSSIGGCVFYGCSRLTSATVPNTLYFTIYDYTFERCPINKVTLTGKGAWTRTDEFPFSSVKTLIIGSEITSLPKFAVSPTMVNCYATTPPSCSSGTFVSYTGALHVPTSSSDAYSTADYWKNFTNLSNDLSESVSLNQTEATLTKNATLRLSATTVPTDEDVQWCSSNPAVAKVSDNGTVTAVSTGECDIFASLMNNEAVYASCHLSVTQVKLAHGDINGDSSVDVTDLALLIDVVLGKRGTDDDDILGDCHVAGGTSIDISDVSALINIVLGK